MDTCYHVTLWFCSVAIDNGPCVDDLPTQMVIFHGNLLNYQRVSYAIAGCLWSGWFHYSNVWCKKSWPLLVSVVDIWLMNLISCNYYVILHFDMYAYYIYTYIYTHSYIHTYIHTYVHTYIIYMENPMRNLLIMTSMSTINLPCGLAWTASKKLKQFRSITRLNQSPKIEPPFLTVSDLELLFLDV